ncbi:MAG: HupE/UreJ family protein [Bacteroidetes bacterium]|nr:HupE/UreJ family protein [Bacteroidota bacterium]MBU1373676.1 HupE/UreJ family protein [Bacteroidota bacterium]MBU1485160.1 HupE/UreJ family protein [Bacteroidota bacterium]MBU1759705.1 HupE/UreJ family protein [Bacteroidota bacterium]MBU2266597.1 HupE/UreJ family protein [Bacteroidota bacterium]
MQDFSLYFELGWQHILDWQGYDHILFVAALCGVYLIADWKKILVLVTAFTIGHSVTLALSVFHQILIPSKWIEFLIPITILITAFVHIARKRPYKNKFNPNYILALLFGLIHGMGFSNYLKSLLGKRNNVVAELLAFNLGLEFGQIIIVFSVLLVSFIAVQLVRVQKREWSLFLSSAIFGIALIMAIERWPL